MRQRPRAFKRAREGLSEGWVSAREGGESIGPRCPVSRDGMALSAAKSKSTMAQRKLCPCGGQSWQPGSIIGMQQGIQTAEDSSSIMPSGVRPRICRWQGAKRVLCTRGSAEREQQPRNLSVGEEQ